MVRSRPTSGSCGNWPDISASPPDRITERQLRDYLMHLREVRTVAKGTFQQHFFGIKFLFVKILAYDWPRGWTALSKMLGG